MEQLQSLTRSLETREFRPPRWLRGPHQQTFWSPLFRKRPELSWRIEELATPDHDVLRLHWLAGQRDRPTLLMLHGLEGTVRSNYVGGIGQRFHRRGWTVGLLEFRSCGDAAHRAPRLYHSGETTDLAFVSDLLAERIGNGSLGGPLLLTGVSLGGNVLTKWLGEAPERVPDCVAGAAAISLPFDLEVSGPTIDHALGGFYRWRFLRTLRGKALRKAEEYPEILDAEAIAGSRTFVDFDTHATARLHGFEDAWDYWRQSGCGQFLDQISRPLLLIAAQDDPFNAAHAIPREAVERNPHLVGLFPQHGGHVGFVAGLPWKTHHWAEDRVEEFFAGLMTHRA